MRRGPPIDTLELEGGRAPEPSDEGDGETPEPTGALWSHGGDHRPVVRPAGSSAAVSDKTFDLASRAPGSIPQETSLETQPGPRATSLLAVGAIFAGRYRIVRKIGSGGMGAVYEVVHVKTARRRAMKVLHPHLLHGPDARERFEREAYVAAHVESEFIIDVLDAGIDEVTEMPYLVMDLLKGEDLETRLRRRARLEPADVIKYLFQAAVALGHLRRANVVHRDIKPANIFVTVPVTGPAAGGAQEKIKLLDFGIAKLVATGSASGGATQSLGTPVYMAPEQFRTGSEVSPATDVFALGMVAYTLLVGVPYWYEELIKEGVFALVAVTMQGPSEPATKRAQRRSVSLPSAFDAWFARMTQERAEARPKDAVSAVVELAKILGVAMPHEEIGPDASLGASMTDRVVVVSKPPSPAASRRRYVGISMLALAVAGGIAAYVSFLRPSPESLRGNPSVDQANTSPAAVGDAPAGEPEPRRDSSTAPSSSASAPPIVSAPAAAPAGSDAPPSARPVAPAARASGSARGAAASMPATRLAPALDEASKTPVAKSPEAPSDAKLSHPLYSRE